MSRTAERLLWLDLVLYDFDCKVEQSYISFPSVGHAI